MVYNSINGFGEIGLFAQKNFNVGDIIFSKKITSFQKQPDKYSIQIGQDTHFQPGNGVLAKTNHNCFPCAKVLYTEKTIKLIALVPILIDMEVTFNYLTTEYQLNSPFKCNCGAIDCYREIKGYRFLTETQKKSLQPYVLNYLRER